MRASVAITVNPYPQFPLPTLASGSVGTPYSQTLTLNGGTPPFAWQVFNGEIAGVSTIDGLVPDGLTLDPTTGTISGTPTAGGTWYFEATAKDAAGVRLAGALSIQINPSPEQANPVPFLNQPLAPTAVSPGASDFVLKVSGAGFVPGATVDFNRSALETTFVDSGHLSAVVPASDAANPGTASVTVTNPSPGGGRSNVVNFEVGAPEASPTFVSATIPLSQIPSEPAGLTVADFNEDGKPDLAVTVGIRVYVALGKGDGTFSAGFRLSAACTEPSI
ncbi:MAG: putative Ig domain-containing protein [Acidobacteria bacterium]|nr:putative Ig domain-containing protein [Acidobacteriota bacterium]